MLFSFNTDGSFDFDTLGVPEEQAGKGTGWYIVYGNKRVIYMESDGVFKFEVVDADTISITELFPDENGELVPGDTAPYTRVK